MKRILTCTLAAVLLTLAPAFAGNAFSPAPGGKVIELEMTKYGSGQNPEGLAKVSYLDERPTEEKGVFGVAITASVKDGTAYALVITTLDGDSRKVATFKMYLGSAVVQLSQAQLGRDLSVRDIEFVTVHDGGGIVLFGTFSDVQPPLD